MLCEVGLIVDWIKVGSNWCWSFMINFGVGVQSGFVLSYELTRLLILKCSLLL